MIGLWLAVALGGDVADVRTEVASGAWINWSDLKVEVEARAQSGGMATYKSAEAEARRVLGPRLASTAREVQVDGAITLGDLEAGPAMGESVATRMARWSVGEARYHASGRIELVGELSLRELLKPWTLSAAQEPPSGAAEPAFTGLVVDARGVGLEPCWAPRLAAGEDVLWGGALWEDVAYERAPVTYVADASHPAAMRAGENPLFVRASAWELGTITLDEESAVKMRTAFSNARTLGDGTVVVVVDE